MQPSEVSGFIHVQLKIIMKCPVSLKCDVLLEKTETRLKLKLIIFC